MELGGVTRGFDSKTYQAPHRTPGAQIRHNYSTPGDYYPNPLRCAHTCALLTSDVHTRVHMCILPTLRMHTHITHPQSFVAELFAAQKVVAECTVFTNNDRYFRESLVSTVRTKSQCSVSGSPEELNSAVI